jgi:hypothetical protein
MAQRQMRFVAGRLVKLTLGYFDVAKNRLRFSGQTAPVLFAGLNHTA